MMIILCSLYNFLLNMMRFDCYKSKPFVVNMYGYNLYLTVTKFGPERVTHQNFITSLTQVYP